VFENRVLWRLFGNKRDAMTVYWRKFHNDEIQDFTVDQILLRKSNQEG
jgi:hypothetical protein